MNSFVAATAEKARRLPSWAILALGFAWVMGIGTLDCLTPNEVNFSLFYLPAVAWVAWGIGFWHAAVLGAVAAVAITIADSSFAAAPSPEGVLGWNVASRFFVFATVGWLMAEVSRLTRRLASLVEQRTLALEAEVRRHKATTAQLAEAMDLARLAHWEYDVASGVYSFDDRFFALYATTAEREGGRQMSREVYVREFIYPEDVPLVSDHFARAARATEPAFALQAEHRIRRRDGEIRHLLVRVALVRNAAGQPIRFRGVNQDITERKRAEEALCEAHNHLEQRVKERTAELQVANAALRESEANYRRLTETLEQRVSERTAALRESEARFRTLAEATFEGILLSKDGRIVDCNEQVLSIYGYPRAELLGRNLLDFIPAPSHAMVCDGIQKSREVAIEHEVLRKDGSRRVVEVHGRSPNGPDGLRLATIRDVTERKAAEQHLADALELNRTLIANAPIGIAAYKADGQCVLANEAVAQAIGATAAEVLRQNFRQLASWRRSPLLATAEAALRSGQPQHCEFLYTSSFNRTPHLSIQLAPFASKGEAHLLLLVRDVTNERAAEQRLADALELNRALIAHAPIGITAYKADGSCVLTNEAMAQILGGSLTEISQQNVWQLDSWRRSALRETAQTALRTGQAQRCEFRGTTTLGREVHISAHFVAFANKGEAHLLLLVRDITEPKRAERLLLAQRDLGVALSLTNELSTAFDCLLGAAMQLEAIDCGGIYILDTHTGGLRLTAHRGISQQFVEQVSYHGPEAPQTRLMRQGQPLYAALAQMAEQADALCEGLQAVAFVPLCYENTVIGTLNLASRKEQEIPVQTRVAIEAIAAQTAGAIARIKAETERQRLERQLLEVSDREQARMGQDLHDGLCQQLVSLAFDANSLEHQLTVEGRTEATLARRIADYLDQAITEARQLSRGLFPIRLDGEGLPPALEELARTTSERFGIQCASESEGPVLVKSHAMATHLYRIAQEAVNNALKHGRPNSISIALRRRADWLELRVEDDGAGLPLPLPGNLRGMGLHIMDYRARSFGGHLELSRNPGGGTTVSCCVPCQNS